MKIIMGFPLIGQRVAAPDGLPRATCSVPVGAKIIHLGVSYPADTICVFAVVDPPQAPKPGEAPEYPETRTLEFAVLQPGMPAPSGDFMYRGPVRAKQTLEDGTVHEGLLFLFEKKPPERMILTPGGRG